MALPSPICTVADGAGSPQSTAAPGVNVTPGNTITIQLASLAGVDVWDISIVGADELVVAPTLSVNSLTKTATFSAPTAGSALILRSTVNRGLDANNRAVSAYSTTFGVYTTISGFRVSASGETFEGNATIGSGAVLNTIARAGLGGVLAADPLNLSGSEAILAALTTHPMRTKSYSLTTTSGGLTSSITIPMADATVRVATVWAQAQGPSGNGWQNTYERGLYYRTGGGNVVVDTAATTGTPVGSLAGCSAALTASGTNNVFTVTGPASNVKWTVITQLVDTTPAAADPLAPTLTSVTPNHGQATIAGTSLSVVGTHFTGLAIGGVTIGGTVVPTYSFVDDTHFTCTAPTGTAGVTTLQVTTAHGSSTIPFTFDAAPTVSSFSPATLPGGSTGAEVITGLNFVATPTVDVSGSAATGVSRPNSTTINATFPNKSNGSYTVTVTNPDGQTGTQSFTYGTPDFDPTAFGSAGDLTFYSRGNLFHLDGNGNVDDTTNVASSPVDSFKNAGAITAHPAKNATGSANSKPSMTFDGVNDTLFTGVAAFSNYMSTTDFTILAVVRYPTWPSNDSATSYSNKPAVAVAGGYTTIAARNKGGTTPVLVGGAFVGSDKYCETPSGQVAANTPFLATLTLHGGTLSISAGMNAVGPSGSVACGAISGAGSSAIALGANYAGADFANYEVMCLIIYKNGNITGLATLQQQITDFYQLVGHS